MAKVERPEDPGGYIGQRPELSAETIPGGVQPGDERIAGTATQSTGDAQRGANPDPGWTDPPEGHREQSKAGDDDVRRAGENG